MFNAGIFFWLPTCSLQITKNLYKVLIFIKFPYDNDNEFLMFYVFPYSYRSLSPRNANTPLQIGIGENTFLQKNVFWDKKWKQK